MGLVWMTMPATHRTLLQWILHAVLLAGFARANSIGIGIPSCDAEDWTIWKPASKGGTGMWWCKAPQHTDEFTLRTGDAEKELDVSVYQPGGLVYVHIRANEEDFKFRGLMLYAVNTKNEKVGGWELPQEDQFSDFHTPEGACEGKAVMHSGAEQKNYHNIFAFRAPPAGTGKITFKCLLKSGPANTGAFHWPNKDGPLSLREAATEADSSWLLSQKGRSCDDTCAAVGKLCLESELEALTDQSSFVETVGTEHVCKLPILQGCSKVDPSLSSDGFCYYHGSMTACKQKKQATLCSASSNTRRAYCACEDSGAKCFKWCADNSKVWEDKCTWNECNGCPQCTKSQVQAAEDNWSEQLQPGKV